MSEPARAHEPNQTTVLPRRRILVVDDEASVRAVLAQYLELEGYLVLQAADGAEALRLAQAQPPDLVVLDLMLPGIDGVEVCRRLRAAIAAPILLLTARSDETEKLIGFGVGTGEYVAQPRCPREVAARVQAIMRRLEATGVPAMVRDDTLCIGSLVIHPRVRLVERNGQPIDLTAKEFDLLHFLATRPRQVFSRQQLLDSVWDFGCYADPSTVTVHVHHLREKVESDPARPQHVKTVWGVGYKFEP